MGVTVKKKVECHVQASMESLQDEQIDYLLWRLQLKSCDLRGLNFDFIYVKIFPKNSSWEWINGLFFLNSYRFQNSCEWHRQVFNSFLNAERFVAFLVFFRQVIPKIVIERLVKNDFLYSKVYI